MLIIAVLILDTKYNLDNSVFYVFIISSNPQTNRVQIIIHSFDPMNNIRRYTTSVSSLHCNFFSAT